MRQSDILVEQRRGWKSMDTVHTGRIAKWDHTKLFLIICVVMGHMLSRYLKTSGTAKAVYYFVYLFHMPAFVMVSGLFSKRVIQQKKYDKIFGYLVLYFFIIFVNFVAVYAFKGKISLKLFSDSSPAWYAFAMFAFFLMTVFLQQFSKKFVFMFAVVMGCMAGYDSSIGNFLAISRIITFYPFFLMGYYLDSNEILQFVQKKYIQIIAVAVLVCTAVFVYRNVDQIYWTMNLLKGKYTYDTLDEYVQYGAVLRLFFYVVSTVLSFSVIAVMPSRRYFFSYMGERTLSVYALHMFFVYLFFDGMKGGAFLRSIWPEHYLVLIVLVSFMMVVLLSWKPLNHLVTRICFPQKIKQ